MIDHQHDVVNVNVFGLKKMNDIQTKSDDEEEPTLSMGLTAHFKSVNK